MEEITKRTRLEGWGMISWLARLFRKRIVGVDLSSTLKPREWLINADNPDAVDWNVTSHPLDSYDLMYGSESEYVHVIEYAAYEKLEQENARLRDLISKVKGEGE